VGRLDSKNVVVTGAGRGLGRSYAIAAAREGAAVVVNDVDGDEADRVVAEIIAAGGRAIGSHQSVADADGANGLMQQCVTSFGRIDGLVNNAGIIASGPPHEADPVRTAELVAVNVLGVLYCGIAAMAFMRPQRSGVIVNVTSGAAVGMPGLGVYGATKGAVASVTYSWALDLAADGVRVSGFSPLGRTRMGRSDALPDPDSIAPAVVYLLSDAAVGLSGQILRFDGSKLSFLSAPVFDGPFMQRDDWTLDDMSTAVDDGLRASLRPIGMAQVDLTALGVAPSGARGVRSANG
jgi:NAD(P)-dependent dehydrogenase (short-subunit alcohol dehydrogenase family)